MATTMSEEELEAALESATLVDEGGYDTSTSGDEDDYIEASLYKAADGRHFRHLPSTGMNSVYNGETNVGEWLDAGELGRWDKFD